MSDSDKNYCALIFEGSVTEIIVADFEWVEANLNGDWHDLGGDPLTVGVGYIYDPATNTFSPPPRPTPLPDGD
jgi:hypothetical protein